MSNDETPVGVNPKDLFSDDSKQSETSKLVDVIRGVMSTEGMSVRTVLDDKHIVALTQGIVFAEQFNCSIMTKLCQTLMEVRVSLDGRGRKDLIASLKSVSLGDSDSELNQRGRMGRFFG